MTDVTESAEPASAAEIHAGPPVQDGLPLLVVSLLKGALYRDRKPDVWTQLEQLQAQVRDHVAVLGLELIIDDAEGYAFFRSTPATDDETAPVPRLMARRPLSFPVSLLLALLRKRLAEFDASGGGETRLIVTLDEIAELLRLFLPDSTNEAKMLDQIDRHVNKVVELGFLRRLDQRATPGRSARFEVQRILKAYVDGQWLSELDQRLAEYRERLVAEAGDGPTRGERDG